MITRSLALGGMTALLMTLSAAGATVRPAHIGSPLSIQPVAQQSPSHGYMYYQCFTDDGYGRYRPCDAGLKRKRK